MEICHIRLELFDSFTFSVEIKNSSFSVAVSMLPSLARLKKAIHFSMIILSGYSYAIFSHSSWNYSQSPIIMQIRALMVSAG